MKSETKALLGVAVTGIVIVVGSILVGKFLINKDPIDVGGHSSEVNTEVVSEGTEVVSEVVSEAVSEDVGVPVPDEGSVYDDEIAQILETWVPSNLAFSDSDASQYKKQFVVMNYENTQDFVLQAPGSEVAYIKAGEVVFADPALNVMSWGELVLDDGEYSQILEIGSVDGVWQLYTKEADSVTSLGVISNADEFYADRYVNPNQGAAPDVGPVETPEEETEAESMETEDVGAETTEGPEATEESEVTEESVSTEENVTEELVSQENVIVTEAEESVEEVQADVSLSEVEESQETEQ